MRRIRKARKLIEKNQEEASNPVGAELDRLEILSRFGEAKSFSRGWHENIIKWRKLYNFDHYKKKPKPGESQFADPTYTNTVDLGVGIFQSNKMSWEVTGWTPGEKEQRDSSKIEKYLAGVLAINSYRNEYNIFYETHLHFMRDGGAVLYSIWDTELEEGMRNTKEFLGKDGLDTEVKKFLKEPPIRVRVIDPLKIHVVPGGKFRWKAIYREDIVSVYDVETEFSVKVGKYSKLSFYEKRSQKGRLVDYWDYAYVATGEENKRKLVVRNATLFDEEWIVPLREMPGYAQIPYTIRFFKPTARDDSSKWQSIINPMETSVAELEKAINRRQRQIDKYSSMNYVAKVEQGRIIDADPGLGDIIQIHPGEDFGLPEWHGDPPDVDRQISYFHQSVQQSGFPEAMYGEGAGLSGYALSQLNDQGRIRLEMPGNHLEDLWTAWGRKVIEMTISFAVNTVIAVSGFVKGTSFADYVLGGDLDGYQITCAIEPQFPNEEVRNHAMAVQARGQISNYTILQRYYKIQQPDDEQERMMLEAAKQNPVVIQYGILNKLKELADEGDESAAMALQMLSQQLGSKGAGRPEEEINNPQPLGLQSSTGQPTSSAQGNASPGETTPEAMQDMANAAPQMTTGLIGGLE
jgi:PAS domain-containing protein